MSDLMTYHDYFTLENLAADFAKPAKYHFTKSVELAGNVSWRQTAPTPRFEMNLFQKVLMRTI